MRFSIVTIAYNQARFVEQALRSVLDQDYPDLEYIVVDPGSTDGTREIIERYRDRISKVIYRSDKGAAHGLNNGFAEGTGELFGFLNSDDLLLPGTLSRVARAFRERPEIDLATGHMWIVDKHGTRLRKSYGDRFDVRAFAYGACVICQQATFFRARLFREVGGFNPSNRVAWDAELFLDMLKAPGRHVLIDEMLAEFRIHNESVTGSRRQMGLHHAYFEQRFERVMGRPWRKSDDAVRYLYMIRKYLLEPRSLIERVRHGPIVKHPFAPKY